MTTLSNLIESQSFQSLTHRELEILAEYLSYKVKEKKALQDLIYNFPEGE